NQTSRPDTSVPAHSPKEPNTPSNLSVRASQSLAPSAEPAERGRQSSYTPAEEAEVYAELEKLKASDPVEPKFRLPDDKTYDELIREDIIYRLREKRRFPEITPEKSIWLSHLRYLKSMTPEEIAHHDDVVKEDLNGVSESYVKDYFWQNPVQYSIVGEKGMENLSRESKEGLWRLEYLQTAKKMLNNGRDMKSIKMLTGWELGGDGKWRTELPDLKVKAGADMIMLTKKNPTLQDIVDAPEIFKAYPEIAATPVAIVKFQNESGKAMDAIEAAYVSDGDYFGITAKTMVGSVVDADHFRNVLIHEVQHKIQQIEGFAPGGNPDQFKGKTESLKEEVDAFRKKAEASEKYRRYEQMDREFGKWFATATDEEINSWYSKYGKEYNSLNNDPEVKKIRKEKLDIVKRYGNSLRVLDVLNDPENEEAWNAIALDDDSFKHGQYRRLAGEVESRNAERRSKMTLAQRLSKLLSETEDVAEKDKIYLENAAGEALMSIDENGNYFPGPDEWGTAYTSMTGKGRAAIDLLLEKQEGFVPGAFQRNDIGDIDLVYGKTGQGAKDKGGYGLAHILKRHPGMNWDLFSQLIETGTVQPINQRRINIVDGNAKTIIQLEWRGQKRNWVVSAMGGDLTSTADSLLANDPQGAAKQGIAPKGIVTIGDVWEKASRDLKKTQKNSSSDQSDTSDQSDQSENTEPYVQHSLVKDPGLLKKLDAEEKRGEYLTLYRAAQLRDGKLYSPMAAKINGQWPEPIQLGQWEQADEHPELIVKGNKFTLNKGNGATIDARYNPYIHSSPSPLNDQF
ncbi:MAG: hypothetical protein IKO93_03385, partial [Lentisphaeria bacterium]|nr:hypothetical protein [Lentisphaeria bacterium]